VCGNNIVEAGETCDGNCPTTCNDNNACTTDVLLNPGPCQAKCSTSGTITTCSGGYPDPTTNPPPPDPPPAPTSDGCCPSNCVATPLTSATFDQDCGYNVCLTQAAAQTPPQDPKSACVQCNCQNCTFDLDRCYNSTDLAGGATTDRWYHKSKGALCAAVVNCGRASGCRGTACYGTGFLYLTPGPCRTEVENAAESTDALTIVGRQNNTTYAVGRANAVGGCSDSKCAGKCP
jgi:hypothetical protein